MKTRSEHLAWCKSRALECIDRGEVAEAMASMASDLRKHQETTNHSGIDLGLSMLLGGLLSNQMEMRRFIEGFN